MCCQESGKEGKQQKVEVKQNKDMSRKKLHRNIFEIIS